MKKGVLPSMALVPRLRNVRAPGDGLKTCQVGIEVSLLVCPHKLTACLTNVSIGWYYRFDEMGGAV
jgi:hypothetical protein